MISSLGIRSLFLEHSCELFSFLRLFITDCEQTRNRMKSFFTTWASFSSPPLFIFFFPFGLHFFPVPVCADREQAEHCFTSRNGRRCATELGRTSKSFSHCQATFFRRALALFEFALVLVSIHAQDYEWKRHYAIVSLPVAQNISSCRLEGGSACWCAWAGDLRWKLRERAFEYKMKSFVQFDCVISTLNLYGDIASTRVSSNLISSLFCLRFSPARVDFPSLSVIGCSRGNSSTFPLFGGYRWVLWKIESHRGMRRAHPLPTISSATWYPTKDEEFLK